MIKKISNEQQRISCLKKKKGHILHCRNMIFVHTFGFIQFSSIIAIAVAIFISLHDHDMWIITLWPEEKWCFWKEKNSHLWIDYPQGTQHLWRTRHCTKATIQDKKTETWLRLFRSWAKFSCQPVRKHNLIQIGRAKEDGKARRNVVWGDGKDTSFV